MPVRTRRQVLLGREWVGREWKNRSAALLLADPVSPFPPIFPPKDALSPRTVVSYSYFFAYLKYNRCIL